MARRIIEVNGQQWIVSVSGRYTQYNLDEFGLVFTRGEGPDREVRLSRFTPRGAKSRELAVAELSDQDLTRFLLHSQPAATAPETGYARAGLGGAP